MAMRMTAWRLAVTRAALLGIAVGVAGAARADDVALSQPLPMDPALVRGTLDNGLSYIIRQHNNPPGRAGMWIHFSTGSLNETDKQRGLAHYLEHMAFNGSANFPPGKVVDFFQSLGMQFGRDQNAFTSFEETAYQLSLPDAKPETLAQGMTFFADVLHRLELRPEEINKERQIIQEERRARLSGRQRTMFYVLERLVPGSIFGQRITIGTEETINSVQKQDFVDYYSKYYTASNATVIVVADADPKSVEAMVKEKFGPAPKAPRPADQDVGVRAYEKHFAIVTSDPELTGADLRVGRVAPARPASTSVGDYRRELVENLAVRCFGRRIDGKVERGGTSYQSIDASMGNEAGVLWAAEVSARSEPSRWKEAFRDMIVEMQRARAFGFLAHEFEAEKKEILSGAERAVQTESTRPANAFLSRIASSVNLGEPILSAQQNLELVQKLLPTITLEEVSKTFAKEFDPGAVCFVAVLPSSASVPTEAELVEMGKAALAEKPTPEEARQIATSLMDTLPTPGTVVESGEHAASQVTSAWLSNNVRVHHRFMDYRKDQVTVSIALVGGELLETDADRGITMAAQIAFMRPATKRLSSTDVRELMTGKKVEVGGGGFRGGSDDAVMLSVSGSPAELETGMQLAHLLLTEPKLEPAAFEQIRTLVKQGIESSTKEAGGYGARLSQGIAFPQDHARTRPVEVADVDRITVEAAQARIEKLVKESPIEVSIVGDISKERAMELAARYVGSLAKRERPGKEAYAALRKVSRPSTPRQVMMEVQSKTPKAFVMAGFYGPDETNVPDRRAMQMASRILSTRMIKQVREDAQLVYSIGARSSLSPAYPGFGTFSASAPTDSEKAGPLVEKLKEMYREFAEKGVTSEELEVCKKQMAVQFDEQMKEPGYWLAAMTMKETRGRNLDDIVENPQAYQSITGEQILAAYKKYYGNGELMLIVVKPKGETASATPGSK